MARESVPLGNQILDSLSPHSLQRLLAAGSWINLEADEDLCSAERLASFAFFPTTCIIGVCQDFSDGSGNEVLMVGREGFCGSSLFPAGAGVGVRAIVIQPGRAIRVSESALLREFNADQTVRWATVKSIHRSFEQAAQSAACQACLNVEQRVCRWLVMFSERSGTLEVKTTHEHIARALGVRREGVSQAVARLRDCGLILSRRCQITISDPDAIKRSHLRDFYPDLPPAEAV